MILLDTSVITELFKPAPSAHVVDWIAGQPVAALFTSTITRSELFYGAQRLPAGRRKDALLRGLRALFDLTLDGRVLDYDSDAADAHADIAAAPRAIGRPTCPFDAMIAGIARSRGARLATRNLKDFDDCGLVLIDPWDETGTD
ncbi:PIN domain-containing protein [Luteimonas sp. A478]